MTQDYAVAVQQWLALPRETLQIEFKRAENSFNIDALFEYCVSIRGLDRLQAVLPGLGCDARSGAGYVFRKRAGNRLRVVVDATGVWLCQRRLHQAVCAAESR